MKEAIINEADFTEEDFEEILKKLNRKKRDKYKFILQAGKGFKNAIFKLLSTVWDTESKPNQWKITTIIQLFKGKGSINDISNYRNIHLKEDVPKLFETIIVEKAKDYILNFCSKYQIAKPGHRPQEHLFVLKSTMSLYQFLGLPLIIQFFDLDQF